MFSPGMTISFFRMKAWDVLFQGSMGNSKKLRFVESVSPLSAPLAEV